jgi:hypothetical protein
VAVAACLALSACTPGPSPEQKRDTDREVTVPLEILDAPEGVSAVNGGPTCTLRNRKAGRYSVLVSLAGRLSLPRDDAQPVFYEVEAFAADQRFVGWVSGVPAHAHPETRTFWVLPPTPLDVEVADAELAPAFWLGVREVPAPLQRCELRITEPDAQERTGRLVQVSDDGGPVVMDAAGQVHVE